MENQEPAPEDEQLETQPIPDGDLPYGQHKEAPSFSGEQVEFLLRQFIPGKTLPPTTEEAEGATPSRARGGYNSSFGWMHLTTPEVGIHLVIALGLLALGITYATRGLPGGQTLDTDMVVSLQPILLIVLGLLFLVRTVVKWRRSRLYTTETQVVFAVKPFWPLLILRVEQAGKLQKIDASVYSQNLVEQSLRMNSGTLTIDTAAQGDKGLHQLKGVKDIALLRNDIE